ncbi:MAG: MFS transporter, partial [Dokdonella sp.]
IFAQLTHALNFAGFFAACMILMARYFPGRMNGHGQGIFYGFSSGLGGVIGALLAGQTWHFGAGKGAFLICGAIALLAAILAWHGLDRPLARSLAEAGSR